MPKSLPKIKSGADCCGCTGCAAVCPKDAITMVPDIAGFVYPKLDPDKCINCLLCEKVCGFIPTANILPENEYPKYYGARQKDTKEVMKSRSGGVFAAIARQILEEHGSVYGVALSPDFKVSHVRITSEYELDQLRGSKYVQSNLAGIFRKIKEDLLAGRKVLFSGTPCQTSTLLRYIPDRLQSLLFVIDIVCHGVPGPVYWSEFLKFIEKKHGKRISKVYFRDKERFNWKRHQEMFQFESDSEPIDVKYRFYSDIMFRKSCSSCPFTNLNRPSDLTLADFWGYERTGTHINDDLKGLNLILVNTLKGLDMFERIKPSLEWFQTDKDSSLQDSLMYPTPRNPNADAFYSAFKRHGFGYAIMRYGNYGLCAKFNKIVKSIKRRLNRSV